MFTDFIVRAAFGSKGNLARTLLNIVEGIYEDHKDDLAEQLVYHLPGVSKSSTKEEMLELLDAAQNLSKKIDAVLN